MIKSFAEAFPDLHLSQDARELMEQASVVRVTLNAGRDQMRIY